MTRWKLRRLTFGDDEYTFVEGEEVSLGRAVNNTISISSLVVSRYHCVFTAEKDNVIIKDLGSSNGIYVGKNKIPPHEPYSLTDSDIIGIGWIEGARVTNIDESGKYMFKLSKEIPLPNRFSFQNDSDIENELAEMDGGKNNETPTKTSPIKSPRKRKFNEINENVKKEQTEIDVISIPSDSENDDADIKKLRLESPCQKPPATVKEEVKTEKDEIEYDVFHVKQEYQGYDEPIAIDSDSDDGESVQWLMRLSQSSPGKPFTKALREIKKEHEESSYSQIDDDIEDEDILENLITIPLPNDSLETKDKDESKIKHHEDENNTTTDSTKSKAIEENDFLDDLISLTKTDNDRSEPKTKSKDKTKDTVDGCHINQTTKEIQNQLLAPSEPQAEGAKRAQIIEPLVRTQKSKRDGKHKSTSSKHRDKKHPSSRKHISDSQKEERKKKLKEIATKEKETNERKSKKEANTAKDKGMVNVKVTNSNRGAFLTNVVQPMKRKESPQKDSKSKEKLDQTSSKDVVQPMKRKESPQKDSKSNEKLDQISSKETSQTKISVTVSDDVENKKKSKTDQKSKHRHKEKESTSKSTTHSKSSKSSSTPEPRVPLKNLKPLSESEESYSGKPFSKVEPLPPKNSKKSVRFSDEPPSVHMFEIEEGNNMKKTSLAKISMVDARQAPIFSLEKMYLMTILRWNPHWFEEQINNNDPPPILGDNNLPMTMFHSFTNHEQYVQLVGNLLLMEIWECLTQGYMRKRGQPGSIEMRIASLPPTQDRCFELFNLSVNVSVPNSEIRSVPRMGEVLIVAFGPEHARNRRFFYVHNVRNLPSPPNNIHSFFCISLHTCYTEKMKTLKPGVLMVGVSLAYIQKEMMLFEAMEYLRSSPLCEAILRPEPRHFVMTDPRTSNLTSQWTKTLNPSQQMAVHSSVSAALGDQPRIQMVQGPPGTGKSSVICAIAMTYFYDSQGRRQQNRSKILICATSNAAVDELVCRLLEIRQKLPKEQRFRMVRVGRAEAMHPRALDISSQQLAQRDAAARQQAEPAPGISEEISHLEAKINMWRTQEQDAKDPVRAAYCKGRVTQLQNRLILLRSGAGAVRGEELRAEQLAAAERRIIEGADIVVTTLASAHNHKMRGLRRRIALCIVDEAGQAIEPETLVPLTLDVTKLTLIGDPQQLPGYICSQRAKKHGLGDSLFARLTSCAEHWPENTAVVLLNQQYRMQADIAEYPNRAFYGGRIVSVPPARPALPIPPYSIVSISSGDKGQDTQGMSANIYLDIGISGANEMEAWGVTRLVLALHAEIRQHSLSLAVITPYNAHKELIKKNLRLLQHPSEGNIEVNTVDSFQGQERDVVVVSLARSQGVGFLTDAGRMNVMLTRAKHALVVCLNPHAMLKNYQWRTLVEDAQKRNLYRILPNKICQGASAGKIPHEEVLKYVSRITNK